MIIGIDPGVTGAVAVVSPTGELIAVVDIPVMAKGKGKSKVKNQVNAAELAEIVRRVGPTAAFVERVSSMPGQGVASMFSMGDTFGCIRGVLAAIGVPVHIVTPQKWKKHYSLGADKEIARAKAIELYPQAPLSRKRDQNRAEALLIARYGAEGELPDRLRKAGM